MSPSSLLTQLLEAHGPSGHEGPAAAVWRESASFAEVSSDSFGSSFARLPGEDGAVRLGLVGHIDEIGLAITHIDDKGLLWFNGIGGWDPQNLVGQRVTIAGSQGPVPGVIGKKAIHLLEAEERKKAAKLKDLHIDIGAADTDEARALVREGDAAVIAASPIELLGDRLASRCLDNRIGAYVVLEALRGINQESLQAEVIAVAAAQEEIGLKGAKVAAHRWDFQAAIAVDVTHATDVPGVSKREQGDHALGSGCVIERGSTLHPMVTDSLIEIAEAEEIPYTIGVSTRGTSTDADVLQLSRGGVATGLVSVPIRYMHSPVEVSSLHDIEAAVRLLTSFAGHLAADTSFLR